MGSYLVIKRIHEDRVHLPGEVLVDPPWAAILVGRGYLQIVPEGFNPPPPPESSLATTYTQQPAGEVKASPDEGTAPDGGPVGVSLTELLAVSRAELNQLAIVAGVEAPEALANKLAVAEAIMAAQGLLGEGGDTDDTDTEDNEGDTKEP